MDDPNPLVWPQNPLTQGGPTWADAWTYNSNAAQNWLQQQRQASYDQGLADPNTGLPTPQGWQSALQQYTNSLLLGTKSPGITAYHGSPHSFDSFDMSKIGTGEGAQMYGRGLYFAEAEPVAHQYRDSLAGKPQTVAKVDGVEAPPEHQDALMTLTQNGPVTVPKPEEFVDYLSDLRTQRDKFEKLANSNPGYIEHYLQARSLHDQIQGVADVAQNYTGQRVTQDVVQPGQSYEVRLNTTPNAVYDWDKPFGEQSKPVQKAMRSVADQFSDKFDVKLTPDATNSDLIPLLKNPDAVAALRDAGVNGVRYLDEVSRKRANAGRIDLTRNYVMFNDKLIDIVRKYGVAGLGIGLGAGNALDQSQ